MYSLPSLSDKAQVSKNVSIPIIASGGFGEKKDLEKAYKAGADLVLLDDGHQNFSIEKNITILVFDAELSLKNERIFPRGNLRESPLSAIARADFLICIGCTAERKKFQKTFLQDHDSKIIEGEFKPNNINQLRKRKLVAFCGIGRPEKFFSMLKKLNMDIKLHLEI